MSGLFWCCQCKSCGKYSVQEVRVKLLNAVFRCKYCGKSTKMYAKTLFQMRLAGKHSNPQEATKQCIAMNGQASELCLKSNL